MEWSKDSTKNKESKEDKNYSLSWKNENRFLIRTSILTRKSATLRRTSLHTVHQRSSVLGVAQNCTLYLVITWYQSIVIVHLHSLLWNHCKLIAASDLMTLKMYLKKCFWVFYKNGSSRQDLCNNRLLPFPLDAYIAHSQMQLCIDPGHFQQD